MLKIVLPATEQYDDVSGEFITSKEQVLQLEHSLVSLSKWEAKHRKPFLSREPKTVEETVDYIRCMTLTQNVDPGIYASITSDILDHVSQYIDATMTATTFPKDDTRTINREIVTSEIIYYWMVSNRIPFECQKWHLDRLLTLINVCNVKNRPQKKMNRRDLMNRNKALNDARRNQFHTRG